MIEAFRKWTVRTNFIVSFTALFCCPFAALADSILNTAENFVILAGSTVSNTGLTAIHGDLGLWPGTAYIGDSTVTHTGTAFQGDSISQTAHGVVRTAYDSLAGLPFDTALSGIDLGGLTLNPGVYSFATSAQLTGTLILDALGDPNAYFVFQIGSTLTTSVGAAVNVINGGPGNGVYWQVGSSATLGVNSAFAGNILALTSITLGSGATILCGRALARNGAVTLTANDVSNNCEDDGGLGSGRNDFGSFGFVGNAVPEAGTVQLLCGGLLALAFRKWRWRNRRA